MPEALPGQRRTRDRDVVTSYRDSYPLLVVACVALKKPIWFALLVFGLTACGGSSSATTGAPTTTTAAATPTTTAAAEGALAGLAFEVHQEPG